MTEPPLSKPSQLPLTDSITGKSIIPPIGARCPNCKKIGGIRVNPFGGNSTIRTPDGRTRARICLLCDHEFETYMKLPYKCDGCGAIDQFFVSKTMNDKRGISRTYKCKCCGTNHPTFEPFPVPEDKVNRNARPYTY